MRPVPGRVTVPYWERGTHWAGGHHRGIDYAAAPGTPVVAPWGGTVTEASWGPAYGLHLVIDFDRLPDGAPGLWGVLAHLSQKKVRAGQRVEAGQVVGLSGATGNVTGPHLHFEIQTGPTWRPAGSPERSRNPQPWIDAQKVVPVVPAPPYRNIKMTNRQVIPLNQWVTMDLGAEDFIVPPVGSNDWWTQLHLDFGTLVGAKRNDLRYVKGRWARKTTGPDANAQGLDTHGTDTKAIPADLPKASWQSSFSTDMRGLEGVPVGFQVYVGSMVDGTVESPMRLFTIDDENT